MRNIAIGLGMGAREVGRYRVAGARRTDGVVAPIGVAVTAGVVGGVVGGIPGTDAHPVRRCRADAARLIDGDGEAAGETVASGHGAAPRTNYSALGRETQLQRIT